MGDAGNHQWISAREFVSRTNNSISLTLVYRLCRSGELEAIPVTSGKWLIRDDAWELLQAKRRAEA